MTKPLPAWTPACLRNSVNSEPLAVPATIGFGVVDSSMGDLVAIRPAGTMPGMRTELVSLDCTML